MQNASYRSLISVFGGHLGKWLTFSIVFDIEMNSTLREFYFWSLSIAHSIPTVKCGIH